MTGWPGSWFGGDGVKPGALYARALRDYAAGLRGSPLIVRHRYGVEEVDVGIFFRASDRLFPWDEIAIRHAAGHVVDVGAGAGAVSLALQERGFEVTALEPDPELADLLRERGVRRVVSTPLEEWDPDPPADTLLMLMNGAALAGGLDGLDVLLGTAWDRLGSGGRLLIDSTDLLEAPDEADVYPGELTYRVEYRGVTSRSFPQLFVDPTTLRERAERVGFAMEVVWRAQDLPESEGTSSEGSYLARLERP